jgi:hypothetical protein
MPISIPPSNLAVSSVQVELDLVAPHHLTAYLLCLGLGAME